MSPVPGLKTKRGHELQLGTNTVAPFLFTKLLIPILIRTAKEITTRIRQSDLGIFLCRRNPGTRWWS